MAAGNRKERRAKSNAQSTQSAHSTFQPSTELDDEAINMILKHPDYSGPKGKTLLQMAEERQQELDRAKLTGRRTPSHAQQSTSAALSSSDSEEEEAAAIGPFGDAFLYSVSMAALHLTLDVIVYSQYREEVVWNEIFARVASAAPVFALLVYLTHVPYSYRFPMLRELVFFAGSLLAGCYLVYSGNKHGYFHVMKAAPPVGTLWIWSVIELSLPYAALSAVSVFGYLWWNDFEFF